MTATAKVVDLDALRKLALAARDEDERLRGGASMFGLLADRDMHRALTFDTVLELIRMASPADARVVTAEMRQAALDAMVAEQKVADAEGWPNYKRAQRYLNVALEAAERARPLPSDPMQQIIAAVRAYLPPDGIGKDELIARVIGIVDPGQPDETA